MVIQERNGHICSVAYPRRLQRLLRLARLLRSRWTLRACRG